MYVCYVLPLGRPGLVRIVLLCSGVHPSQMPAFASKDK